MAGPERRRWRQFAMPVLAVLAVAGIAGAAVVLARSAGSPNPSASAISATDANDANDATGPTSTARWIDAARPRIDLVEESITWAQWMARRPGDEGLPGACRTVQRNIAAVRALPPSPDTVVRASLARELADFSTAARQCLDGRLEAAGQSIQAGHRWAQISDLRIATLLHEE